MASAYLETSSFLRKYTLSVSSLEKKRKTCQYIYIFLQSKNSKFCNWSVDCYDDLRFLASKVGPIGCTGHSIVELVARVHVDLEIWADRGLNAGVQTRLHIHSHVFVFVGRA